MGIKISAELDIVSIVTVAKLDDGRIAILTGSSDAPQLRAIIEAAAAGVQTDLLDLANLVLGLLAKPKPKSKRSRSSGIKTNAGAKDAIKAALIKAPLDLAALTLAVGFTSADRALKLIEEMEAAGVVQLEADGKYSLKSAGVVD
jgi:hypothetical protein